MQRCAKLGNGQVEVCRETHADHIEFRIRVSRAHAESPAEPDPFAHLFASPDPTFEWAERRFFGRVNGVIETDLALLPHELGEEFFLDPDTGDVVEQCKAPHVLHLLENSEREQIAQLMRSPDVMRIIEDIRAGKNQNNQRRLQKVLHRYSTPRSGAPIKNADVAIAQLVANVESRLATIYPFVERQRERSDSAAFPENIEAALVNDFNVPKEFAPLIVQSRNARGAACRIVALRTGRTVDAVKVAAQRGAKRSNSNR